MRPLIQQPVQYQIPQYSAESMHSSLNRTNNTRTAITQIQARPPNVAQYPQQSFQPQYQNLQGQQFRPQQPNYAQQAPQVYQQARFQQQVTQNVQQPNILQTVQTQQSFRNSTSQYVAGPQQTQVVVPTSPVKDYKNYPPIQAQILTPNRFQGQYTQVPLAQNIPSQYQQQYIQHPGQMIQHPGQYIQLQNQMMQQQNTFVTPKPVQQPPRQQEQTYNNNGISSYNMLVIGNEDLEKKFEEAINKTKQLVSKYKKPEESQPENPKAQVQQNNGLEDLALQYEDGYIYRGQGIEPSTRQGSGKLSDSENNLVYSGNWYDNQYHGQGVLVNFQAEQLDGPFDYTDLNTIENGWCQYDGGFSEGKMSGTGILTLTNGEKFSGTFDDGTIEGEGAYYNLDNQIIKGYWKDGVLETAYE